MEAEVNRDIREYLSVPRRYKGQILAISAICAAAALAVALGLPAIYRSSATILVQGQEVPPDFVRSTITSFADERIQVISQQVMTRAVLLELVNRYGLYEKYRERETNDEIVKRIRRDIQLTTVNADITERGGGRRENATIAFQISFDSPSPERAQRVVNELVTLYLSENIKARQQSAAETTAFLAQEADRLAKQIQEIETNLAAFKRRYAGRLPDSSAVNMQLSERTESELRRVEQEISMLQDRRLSLEAQLPFVKPNVTSATAPPGDAVQSPSQRLRSLQAKYASASAVYGPDHPDIRRMRREMEALEVETGTAGADAKSTDQLRKLEAELASLRERYAENHPDVQRLKRSIAALKATEPRQPSSKPPPKSPLGEPADNPAYIALSTQLDSTKREIAHLASLREDLRAKQRSYDARLLQIPEIEREYRELTRDYDNAQERYREVKGKQMKAEVAQELERDRKAERFVVLEPANIPEKPFRPNRMHILLIGLAASLGAGVGSAFLRDATDSSVRGPLELERLAQVPILIAIPYIETNGERTAKRRRALTMAFLAAILLVAYLTGVHLFLKPLPQLLESVLLQTGLR